MLLSDLNCGGQAQDVSEEKDFSMLPRNHSCDILGRMWIYFCSCSKSLPQAKEFWVNSLGRGHPKQATIYSVLWLLLLTLIKIYNEKEQVKQGKIFEE